MSIRDVIDACVRCVHCNAQGPCDCWVTLRCVQCNETRRVARVESDPPGEVVNVCAQKMNEKPGPR